MPGRTLLLVAILVLVGTVPIFLSERGSRSAPQTDADQAEELNGIDDSFRTVSVAKEEHEPKKSEPFWKAWFGTTGGTAKPSQETKLIKLDEVPSVPGRPVERNLNGPPGITLGDVLRFEVTPNWVTQNWTQVTTQLMDPDLYGVRVPYSSGTEIHDLTGSLTYYFNAQNTTERITMYGFTGDPEPLAALLQQRFGFKQYASIGPGLYMHYKDQVPVGVMRVEHAPVQKRSNSQRNYRVRLEMNLPREGASLSESMLSELRRLREANLL